jgi:hypothetical protein
MKNGSFYGCNRLVAKGAVYLKFNKVCKYQGFWAKSLREKFISISDALGLKKKLD